MLKIESNQNRIYKHIKSLLTKKGRTGHGQFLVEGIRSVEDVLAVSSYKNVPIIAVSQSFFDQNPGFAYLNEESHQLYIVSDSIFGGLCDTDTPQGILCVVDIGNNAQPDFARKTTDQCYAYVYCDRVCDPGNAGTIIRTAAAAGMAGVIFSQGCVDLYSPKTIRSTMGAFFHIPTYTDACIDTIKECKQNGFRVISGALSDNAIDYRHTDFGGNVIIVVGNEANGVSDDLLAISDIVAKIPVEPQIESLNASIAAAILIYEVRRGRSDG